MILGLLDEALTGGARLARACEVLEIDPRTPQRWKRNGIGDDRRAGPLTQPANALTAAERARILEIANTPEFRDKSPKQIVPILADRDQYLASEATFYRVLRTARQIHHRATSKAPSKRHRPEAYAAMGPNEVWSWDITYLRSALRGSFFYLYMVLDIWSRKIVGFEVHEQESSDFAAWLLEASCDAEGVPSGSLVLHSDNGAPMKGATMLAKLQQLGVATSFSRPRVSNDNPFSESAFRTAKYRPDFPSKPFASLEEARSWAATFVRWYNTEHLHSSINFVTPDDRHAGRHVEMLETREQVYAEAKQRHPNRWSGDTRDWSPVQTVNLNPEPEQEAKIPA